MLGYISSISSLGTVDGPGVRAVIFMAECNLRCPYCHNPETWDKERSTAYTTDQLIENIVRFTPYFKKNGGVTISGGEPLLQSDFLLELIPKLKNLNINVAIDTSGTILNEKSKQVLSMADLILLDIKLNDDENYWKYFNISIKVVLDTLDFCEANQKKVWIRQVIVPDLNDNITEMDKLIEIIKGKKCIEKTELLAFKKLCLSKYESLNIKFPFEAKPQMDNSKLLMLQNYINSKL